MKSLRENIIKYGSYLLVFLSPLVFFSQYLSPHVSTKTFFIYMVVEVMFFVWIYAVIVDRSYRLPKSSLKYFIPLLGFVVWMSLSGIFAVNPNLSFWSSFGRGTGLLTLYHALALSFIVASLVRKYGAYYVSSLFQWFVGGAFILACSIWMGIDGFKSSMLFLKKDAGGGFSGNSTLGAGYLVFALAMAGYLLSIKSISKTKKWLISVAVATIIFSPVFATLYGAFSGNSILGTARGTILAIVAGFGASIVGAMFVARKKVVRGISIAIMIFGLLTAGYLWNQLVTPNTYLNTKFTEQARGSRFIFWDVAQKAMDERPIFGYGAENYPIVYQTYFDPNILVLENSFEGWNDRAHNIYYELGSTGGYPAVILYIAFLISLFYAIYKAFKVNRLNKIQASVLWGLLIAYFVNNLFTFDSNLSLMALFVVAGIIYALTQNENKDKILPVKIDSSNKNLLAVCMFVLLVTSFIFFVQKPSAKSKLYTKTFSSPINQRVDLYPNLLKGSHAGSDWDASNLIFETYRLYASNPSAIKNDKEKLPYLVKNLEAIIAYSYKLAEQNPTDYRLHISISFLENTLTYLTARPYDTETQNRVLEFLEKARALSPTNPNVYWSIAQVKVWGNDLKGAEEAYKESIRVAPNIRSSYNLTLQYAQVVGNKKLFDEILIQAKENIPGYELK